VLGPNRHAGRGLHHPVAGRRCWGQSCTLAAGSALPSKSVTYTPGDYYHLSWFTDNLPFLWLSDYQYTANNVLLWADNVTYTITPSGALNITSFYAFAHDTCQYNLTTGISDYCF
jgi:hypothetical protein